MSSKAEGGLVTLTLVFVFNLNLDNDVDLDKSPSVQSTADRNFPIFQFFCDVVLIVLHSISGPYDCDFTENMCGWRQSSIDDFDWTRKSEGTPSLNTGPDWDHTGLIQGVKESYGRLMFHNIKGSFTRRKKLQLR